MTHAFDQIAEHRLIERLRHQADVLGEKRKHQLGEEACDLHRLPLGGGLGRVFAHQARQFGELVRQFFGQALAGAALLFEVLPELLRVGQQPADEVARFLVQQIAVVELDRLAAEIGELRIDAVFEHVRHYQQRRVVKIAAVGEQLVIRCVEVFELALVLPRKMTLEPYIRAACASALFGHMLLEGEEFALRIALGRRLLVHQLAQLVEVALRGLLFTQLGLFPTLNEVLGRDHGSA
ncbi:MAG: hypothetical protein HND48_19470 [Chloroflexi bacterium]|nr:hypothetical protein [Chloroflexota bacterium]